HLSTTMYDDVLYHAESVSYTRYAPTTYSKPAVQPPIPPQSRCANFEQPPVRFPCLARRSRRWLRKAAAKCPSHRGTSPRKLDAHACPTTPVSGIIPGSSRLPRCADTLPICLAPRNKCDFVPG